MSRIVVAVSFSFVLMMGLSSRSALGADADVPAASATASADRHFQLGVAHYDRASYAAALSEFQKAYEMAPDFRVLYNIAQASFQLGHVADARVAFRRYLTDGAERVPSDRRQRVEATLADLEAAVGRLLIEVVDAPGARVLIDGRAIGTAPIATAIVVDPGRHEIRAELEPRPPAAAIVDVPKGVEERVVLHLEPAPPKQSSSPTPARDRRMPIGPIVLASGGVVLVASLVSDLIVVRSKLSDFESLRDSDDPAAGDARRSAKTFQTVTVVGYIAGAAIACVGAAITFWPWRSSSAPATPAKVVTGANELRVVF